MTQQYLAHSYQRQLWLLLLLGLLAGIALFAIRHGAYPIAFGELLQAFMGEGETSTRVAIWNIRLPRVVGAFVCGWGLALSGLTIQTLLKNPLAASIPHPQRPMARTSTRGSAILRTLPAKSVIAIVLCARLSAYPSECL